MWFISIHKIKFGFLSLFWVGKNYICNKLYKNLWASNFAKFGLFHCSTKTKIDLLSLNPPFRNPAGMPQEGLVFHMLNCSSENIDILLWDFFGG